MKNKDYDDVLININPKTDFEKLMFATNYIDKLKESVVNLGVENGKLQSEIDELKFILKQDKPENNKLLQYKKNIKRLQLKLRFYKQQYERINSEIINKNLTNEKANT